MSDFFKEYYSKPCFQCEHFIPTLWDNGMDWCDDKEKKFESKSSLPKWCDNFTQDDEPKFIPEGYLIGDTSNRMKGENKSKK